MVPVCQPSKVNAGKLETGVETSRKIKISGFFFTNSGGKNPPFVACRKHSGHATGMSAIVVIAQQLLTLV